MDKRRFIQILQKYREGIQTEEEQNFIESYYNLFETEPELEAWLSQEERQKLKENILHDIWEKIKTEQSQSEAVKIKRRRAYAVRIAAAILILLSTGLLFYLVNNQHTETKETVAKTAEQSFKNDIHPGGNKAILTLANGKQLILDSTRNGVMAYQGNTKIIKFSSGQLGYEAGQKGRPEEREALYNTITTPRGGQYRVLLADGTKVWLNAASSIYFPTSFTGKERKVRINGEAYFEVASKAGKPFIVQLGEARVEVLGTHFNVNAYDDENIIRTTLAAGAVRISRGHKSLLLKPGQQAGINKKTDYINVQDVNVDQVVAWKNGFFSFNNTNIKAIMHEVARWYNVTIIYATDDLDTKNFSGVISRYDNVEALLKRLQLTGTVHFRVEGQQITVMN